MSRTIDTIEAERARNDDALEMARANPRPTAAGWTRLLNAVVNVERISCALGYMWTAGNIDSDGKPQLSGWAATQAAAVKAAEAEIAVMEAEEREEERAAFDAANLLDRFE